MFFHIVLVFIRAMRMHTHPHTHTPTHTNNNPQREREKDLHACMQRAYALTQAGGGGDQTWAWCDAHSRPI